MLNPENMFHALGGDRKGQYAISINKLSRDLWVPPKRICEIANGKRGITFYGNWTMTYNFDPDRWYENELAVILSKFRAGEITKREYEKTANELDKKHEDMWKRLDGSYEI